MTEDLEREGDLGVQGTAGVVAALAQGRVETLILEDDVEDDSTLWVGHKPSEIAMSAGELRSLGVTEPLEARRPDAIVRAALATDAGVRVVDTGSNLQDDVGALLRWRNGDDRRL